MASYFIARRISPVVVLAALHAAASAAPAVDLAVESFKFLETKEMMLEAAARNADRGDYMRFIWTPTLQQFQKWPKDEAASGHYRECHYALTAFQPYADEVFKAGGKIVKTAPTAKQYFGHRAACARILKGKV